MHIADCSCSGQERVSFLPSNSSDLHFHIEIREHNLKVKMTIHKIAHFHLDWFAEQSSTLDSLASLKVWAAIWFFPVWRQLLCTIKEAKGKKSFLIHSPKTNQQVWICIPAYPVFVVWPWVILLTTLSLSFFIYKIGIMLYILTETHSECLGLNEIYYFQEVFKVLYTETLKY